MSAQSKTLILVGIAAVALAFLWVLRERSGLEVSAPRPTQIKTVKEVDSSVHPTLVLENPDRPLASPIPNEATIDFDDESLSVVLRDRPAVNITFPDNLATELASLQARAQEGDILAARTLYLGLKQCQSFVPQSKAEYEEFMNKFHQTQTYTTLVRGVEIEVEALAGEERGLENSFALCDGLTREEEDSHFDWLQVAADFGDPEAAYMLGHQWLGNTEKGREYLHKAWDAGWYPAAYALAKFYLGRPVAFPDVEQPENEIVEDPVMAFAYMHLMKELSEADKPESNRLLQKLEDDLQVIESTLYPRQRKRGLEIAKKAVESSQCCFSRKVIRKT